MGRAPLGLLALVFGVYLLTASGHTYSTDEETMLAASWSLVETGSLAVHQSESWVLAQGVDGRYYSVFGPGQSVASVPWVGLGLLIGGLYDGELSGFALRLVLSTYNALVSAGVCALLAMVALALGYSVRVSLFLGGVLAFATFLWPHSRTFFAEPAVTLCLLGSFYLALRGRPLVSGLIFAAALLFKVQYAVAVPAFVLYVALLSRRQDGDAKTTDDIARTVGDKHTVARLFEHGVVRWFGGLAVGSVPLLAYNWATFGGPLNTGYGNELGSLLRTPLYEGVYGLLLSPGKGLLLYAPPLILSVAGYAAFRRRHASEAFMVAVLAFALVVFFGLFHLWWGGGAWGPRFLVPLLPFALLPALPLIERAAEGGSARRERQLSLGALVVATVVGLGFALNLGGVLLNFGTYINSGVDEQRMIWEPPTSPLVGHADLLSRRLRINDGLVTMLKPTGTLFLKYGFSYSEGDRRRGELLPRWTTGNGGMDVHADVSRGAVSLTLRIADHRPPELGRADVQIMVERSPVSVRTAPVPDSPISTDYTIELLTSPARVEVRSLTWNPALSGVANRNEDIGVRLERVTVFQGGAAQEVRLVEDLPPPLYYSSPRWYYDPDANHPADLWFVYLARAGLGGRAALATALPLLLVALASLVWGTWQMRRVGREALKGRK